MAKGRPHTGMFVRRDRRSDGTRTNQYTAIESTGVDSRGQMVGQVVTIALSESAGRDVFRHVPLCAKSGQETLLALETGPVRTKPYPHDRSPMQMPRSVVQRACHLEKL